MEGQRTRLYAELEARQGLIIDASQAFDIVARRHGGYRTLEIYNSLETWGFIVPAAYQDGVITKVRTRRKPLCYITPQPKIKARVKRKRTQSNTGPAPKEFHEGTNSF